MPRAVSASEAKVRFGSIVDWAIESHDEVIVESYGHPKVVIMPFEEYERVVKLRDQARRQAALARLDALRQRVQARHQDLAEEEVEAIAEQLSQETFERMTDEGKMAYQGQ